MRVFLNTIQDTLSFIFLHFYLHLFSSLYNFQLFLRSIISKKQDNDFRTNEEICFYQPYSLCFLYLPQLNFCRQIFEEQKIRQAKIIACQLWIFILVFTTNLCHSLLLSSIALFFLLRLYLSTNLSISQFLWPRLYVLKQTNKQNLLFPPNNSLQSFALTPTDNYY